ncbi:hypothetical protein [Paenibacillus sp. DYY-L-2]|uniref:hypothetical protein n=1 Tax=Paenibacillus sp. DYY-L-2 TaxID=3447013 RepID=UPI003F4FAD9A
MGNIVGHIDCVYLPVLSYKTDHIEETYHTLKERELSVSAIPMYDGNRFDVWSGWL